MPVRREERILNLLSALLAAREPVPWSEIRGEISGYDDGASEDALEKRFDRDKADLRALGVPLEYVAEDEEGRSGYVVAKGLFFLDEIRFTVEEGIVLAALQRAAAGQEAGALGESLRSALAKIGVDSPLSEALRESVGEQHLIDPRLPPLPGEGELLARAAEALAALRPIRFSYYSLGSGEVGTRTVEPYGMGYFRGNWYLVGRDVAKDAERVFRMDRVRGEVEVLAPTGYRVPEDFSLVGRIGVPPWELARGPEVRARIRFDPDVAWMIAENLRPGQAFEEETGTLELGATDAEALVRWTAQYGPLAEILEPAELRERMARHLAAVVEGCAS